MRDRAPGSARRSGHRARSGWLVLQAVHGPCTGDCPGQPDRSYDPKLEHLRGHELTNVDASSLVLLSRLRIRRVWETDRDLSIEGARVVPAGA